MLDNNTNSDGTHVTHCCIHHGCKYGSDNCPVVTGRLAQEYDCEVCYEQKSEHKKLIDEMRQELPLFFKERNVDPSAIDLFSSYADWKSERFLRR